MRGALQFANGGAFCRRFRGDRLLESGRRETLDLQDPFQC